MAKSKCKINGFKYPSKDKLSGRISTICRSMACTLLDRKACSEEEETQWKNFFPTKTCAYCGGNATHLDHLHPLIIDKKPTGYETEPGNLVPCCGHCNQEKGNKDWEIYMKELRKECTTDKEKKEMEERIDNITSFQKSMPARKVIISNKIMKKWSEIYDHFEKKLKEAEKELLNMHQEIYKKKP